MGVFTKRKKLVPWHRRLCCSKIDLQDEPWFLWPDCQRCIKYLFEFRCLLPNTAHFLRSFTKAIEHSWHVCAGLLSFKTWKPQSSCVRSGLRLSTKSISISTHVRSPFRAFPKTWRYLVMWKSSVVENKNLTSSVNETSDLFRWLDTQRSKARPYVRNST